MGVIKAPRPLTLAEIDRRLLDKRAAYIAALDRGDLVAADERWSELDALLDVRLHTPQRSTT